MRLFSLRIGQSAPIPGRLIGHGGIVVNGESVDLLPVAHHVAHLESLEVLAGGGALGPERVAEATPHLGVLLPYFAEAKLWLRQARRCRRDRRRRRLVLLAVIIVDKVFA